MTIRRPNTIQPKDDITSTHQVSSSGTILPIQYKACWYESYDQSIHVPFKARIDSIPVGEPGSKRPDNAMSVLRRLETHALFGAYSTIEYATPRNNGGYNTYRTPLLTKQQDMYVSAAMSEEYLLMALHGHHASLPEEIRNLDTASHIRYFQDKTWKMMTEAAANEPAVVKQARFDAIEAIDTLLTEATAELDDMLLVNNDWSLMLLMAKQVEDWLKTPILEPGDTWLQQYVDTISNLQQGIANTLKQYKICTLAESRETLSIIRDRMDVINSYASTLRGYIALIENKEAAAMYLPVMNAKLTEYMYDFTLEPSQHNRLLFNLKRSKINAASTANSSMCRADIIEYGLYSVLYNITAQTELGNELTQMFIKTSGFTPKQVTHIDSAMSVLLDFPKFEGGLIIVSNPLPLDWKISIFTFS